MQTIIALAGNPNCGKTTLFNALTGSHQTVGNWPGVTVEKRSATFERRGTSIELVDLPGAYSLTPYSIEEQVTRDFLLGGTASAVIDIVDATNLERSLFFTLSLLHQGLPVVVAVNLMDELQRNGGSIDAPALSRALGCPVVPISARKKVGFDELLDAAQDMSKNRTAAPSAEENSVSAPAPRTEDRTVFKSSSSAPLTEDRTVFKSSSPAPLTEDRAVFNSSSPAPRTEDRAVFKSSSPAPLTEDRAVFKSSSPAPLTEEEIYARIGPILEAAAYRKRRSGTSAVSDRLDRVLTGRFTALPILILAILIVFYLAFGTPGRALTALAENLTARLLLFFAVLAEPLPGWARSLLLDGALAGAGSVICFLPQVLILYFFMAIIEDTGYMARAAYITDRLLRRLGLSGRSVIPLIMGLGCTTAAAGTVRGVENEHDRRLTAMLLPCISCGAKLPVYALFARVFFPGREAPVIFSLYGLGIVFLALEGKFFGKFVFRDGDSPFIIELPAYRLPVFSSVARRLAERAGDFVKRAGSVIVLMSAVFWFLRYFSPALVPAAGMNDSLLAALSARFAPLFRPLGFGSWQAVSALISGLAAKECIISSLQVMFLSPGRAQLMANLPAVFAGSAGAYAYLLFILLAPPCVSAIAALKREIRSRRDTAIMLATETAFAFLAAGLAHAVLTLL